MLFLKIKGLALKISKKYAKNHKNRLMGKLRSNKGFRKRKNPHAGKFSIPIEDVSKEEAELTRAVQKLLITIATGFKRKCQDNGNWHLLWEMYGHFANKTDILHIEPTHVGGSWCAYIKDVGLAATDNPEFKQIYSSSKTGALKNLLKFLKNPNGCIIAYSNPEDRVCDDNVLIPTEACIVKWDDQECRFEYLYFRSKGDDDWQEYRGPIWKYYEPMDVEFVGFSL